MEPRNQKRLVSVWHTREWNCGTQCEKWGVPFVCLFQNPILLSIVAPFELGLRTRNPCFVAGPLVFGLGTRSPRFVACPLELGLGTRSPRFVAWPVELGLGIRNACSTMLKRTTVFALHCFVLPCVPIKMQADLFRLLNHRIPTLLSYFSPYPALS